MAGRVLVSQGNLEKDSEDYRALHERYEDLRELYPEEEYPKYYGEMERGIQDNKTAG